MSNKNKFSKCCGGPQNSRWQDLRGSKYAKHAFNVFFSLTLDEYGLEAHQNNDKIQGSNLIEIQYLQLMHWWIRIDKRIRTITPIENELNLLSIELTFFAILLSLFSTSTAVRYVNGLDLKGWGFKSPKSIKSLEWPNWAQLKSAVSKECYTLYFYRIELTCL